MHSKFKFATLIASGIQGMAMLIAAAVFWWTINKFESLTVSNQQCYVSAVVNNSDAQRFCLYRGLWRSISLVLVVLGSTQFIFSSLVTCILVFYCQRNSQSTPIRVYSDMDAKVQFFSDCYIVWLGYRLLSMLICINIFWVLFATRPHSNFYTHVMVLMGISSLEFVYLLIFIGACLFLGGKAVQYRVRYESPMCSC